MARLFVLCALIGVALANPTPSNTLPKSILGIFENIPSESKNFEEFVTVFGLPKHAKFDKNNLIGFWKEGDTYYQRFVYWPTTLTFDLPFKLGETQTVPIYGKQYEYVYTLESGETPETPVLRVKFRQVDSDLKFTVEAAFNKDGITATYTRDNIVAKRTYRRTLPPYVMGAFEADASRVNPEALEFFGTIYPLPGGLKWTKNTKFWLGREGDHFVDKIIVSPEYFMALKFKLDEPTEIKVGGETIKATYSIIEITTNKTTMRAETTTSKGKLVYTTVFDRQGATCTVKTDNKEFTTYYKRVLPWLFYGSYEEIPEKTENWEEFMKGDEGCKIANSTKGFRIHRKKDGEYVVSKTLGDKKIDVPFKIDGTPLEHTLPNGKQMKYNTTLLNGNSTYLIVRSQVGEKKYTMEEKVKPCGLAITYRRGDVEAKKYFRRVIPKTVLGTFESPEFTSDEELKTFATAHHAEDLLKKQTVEFSETPDHKYHKKMTVEGGEPQEETFTLGEALDVKCKKTGKIMKVKVFYHENDDKPTLMTIITDESGKKPLMRMTKVFTAEGFESTVVYNLGEGKDKIAKRTYTRKGAAVPFELPTSA